MALYVVGTKGGRFYGILVAILFNFLCTKTYPRTKSRNPK